MGVKAIITQENQIVNYNNITNILVFSANSFHAKFEVRALVAGSSSYYTLALYDTKKSANDIINIIIDWLEKEDPILDLNFPEYLEQQAEQEQSIADIKNVRPATPEA